MKRMLERMNHVLLAVAVLAVLSLTSCEHKDLCHDSLHVVNVKVVFDWRKAPDAAPASMSLYLFPTHGGRHCVTSSRTVTAVSSAFPSGITMHFA